MKRTIKLISLLLFFNLCLTGCRENEPEQTDTSAAKPMEYQELTEMKDGRKNIYVVVKAYESSYWKVMLEGVKAAGEEMDCNIYAAGSNAESEWQVQEMLIDEACSRGADAIILAADDSEQLANRVSKAHKMGIPVILADTIVNTEAYDLCYMTDNLMAGQSAAKEMLRLLKEAGNLESEEVKVAIQVGSIGSQTINERLAGFSHYWTKYAPDGWTIIDDVKCNNGDEDKAVECANEFFETYPDIRGVFATNNGSTVGFARVLKERNKTDVCMVGFDYSDDMAALIAAEEYYASTMLQRQYDMGYEGVCSALQFIDGEESDVKFIDTGVVVVNKDCINDSDIQEILKHN